MVQLAGVPGSGEATICKGVEFLDGVSEPAGRMRDWDGAVAHAKQLHHSGPVSGGGKLSTPACGVCYRGVAHASRFAGLQVLQQRAVR